MIDLEILKQRWKLPQYIAPITVEQDINDLIAENVSQGETINWLREALKKHGVHTDIDCTYGDVISSPDRPQKPCLCGLEEVLKGL